MVLMMISISLGGQFGKNIDGPNSAMSDVPLCNDSFRIVTISSVPGVPKMRMTSYFPMLPDL